MLLQFYAVELIFYPDKSAPPPPVTARSNEVYREIK